jgi:signal peptidase I
VTIIAVAAAAWLFFAPTNIGGSTTYVVTSGISMEPHFHTGDLALVRPTDHYRVGEVAAYHSSLLHVVVLHRIIAIRDGRYTFKGDNNNFLDPVRPTRAQLIGVLWVHFPQGGRVLKAIHSPITAAILCGFVALLLLGTGETRRRRNRRRSGSRPPAKPVKLMDRATPLAPSLRTLLVTFATATAVCVLIVGYAATRPATEVTTGHLSYTQHAGITYHAEAPAGSVYPGGAVTTGDPIFLALVHRVGFRVSYRLSAAGPQRLSGTAQVSLNLTAPTGWTRTMPLSSLRHFTGGRVTIPAAIDLRALQSLLLNVQKETTIPAETGYTVGVALKVHVNGTLAGEPLDAKFAPVATFQLLTQELQPTASTAEGAASAAGAKSTSGSGGFTPSQSGSLSTHSIVPNPLTVAGHEFSWDAIKWGGAAGFVLSALATLLLAVLLQRNRAFDEAARIRARYGHLLVPILVGEDLGWPPVDVTSFKALARLAESAGQLVLHHQADAADTYLVNDSGTVYRYQIKLPLVTWGEWIETGVAAEPVAGDDAATAVADPAALADAASVLADAAAAPAGETASTHG